MMQERIVKIIIPEVLSDLLLSSLLYKLIFSPSIMGGDFFVNCKMILYWNEYIGYNK